MRKKEKIEKLVIKNEKEGKDREVSEKN